MLVPHTDQAYYSRRPTIAIPAANAASRERSERQAASACIRGSRAPDDLRSRTPALIQRTSIELVALALSWHHIWSTANPSLVAGAGLAGPVSRYAAVAGRSAGRLEHDAETPHALQARTVAVPAIPSVSGYAFASPNGTGTEALAERTIAFRMASSTISSHLETTDPHLAFVNANAQAALATLDRVASVGTYTGTVTYPNNNALAQALKAVAGAMVRGIGTKIFWVQTGGYDTHAGQNNAYVNLMGTLNDGVFAFYQDLRNQGLLNDTVILQFSEFGRRIGENGSGGTDHGAGGIMMALGGAVRGGLCGGRESHAGPQNRRSRTTPATCANINRSTRA
jgi:hypothetical protein